MRTITKEVKIYSYSELSEEAKNKVRNDYIIILIQIFLQNK